MDLRTFNLNLLVIFDAIWIHRSLTRAALALHITQPAVSTALGRLRGSFDDLLFNWNGTNMAPTPRAEQLAPQIHALLVSLGRVISSQNRDIAGVDREFMLASADYVFADLGNRLLIRVRQQAPRARLRMVNLDISMFEHAERSGLDLIIAPDLGFNRRGMEHVELFQDTYVGITASDNSAVGDTVTRETFRRLPKIYFNSSLVGIANHEILALNEGDITQCCTLFTYSYLTIPFLLQQSDCIAMVPGRLARLLSGLAGIRTFALLQRIPPLSIYMYWPPRLTIDAHHAWLRQQVIEAARG